MRTQVSRWEFSIVMATPLKIFLAHAVEDKIKVRELCDALREKGFRPWLDERDLLPGQNWQVEISKAIRECDIFLACLSRISVQKSGYIQKELRLALVTYSERPPDKIFIIPVKLDDCEVPPIRLPELGLDLTHIHRVKLYGDNGLELLLKALDKAASEAGAASQDQIRRENEPGPVLSADIWQRLEKATRDAAAIAGFAAMGYYRNALGESTALLPDEPNPSTMADEYATLAILQTLFSIDPLAAELGYQYRVFAEELDDKRVAPKILDKLKGNPIYSKVKTSTEEFRKGWEHSLSILVDSIDGTANFDANLPFFCSAVALFLAGRLSIGAIYDPFHNQVFYGSLRNLADGSFEPVARVWTINTGNVEDLRALARPAARRNLIATHITRSNETARNRFLRFLPFLYEERELNGGTYMLNSGQMALSHVAWGNLGAFLNNTTKIWDVAAGEVLIRAIGGRVTDFKGRDINYGESTDISVLACETPELHAKLLRIIEKNYPWDV